VELFRRLKQCLAEHCNFLSPDSYLAGSGPAKSSLGANNIAEFPKFNQGPLLSKNFFTKSQLNRTAGVAKSNENKFTDISKQHNTPCSACGLSLFIINKICFDIDRCLPAIKPTAIRIDV
jgi:hypothetical protein